LNQSFFIDSLHPTNRDRQGWMIVVLGFLPPLMKHNSKYEILLVAPPEEIESCRSLQKKGSTECAY
jgi:hypothetical protein